MSVQVGSVAWSGGAVSTRSWEGSPGRALLLAHGAGTGQDHPLVAGLAEAHNAVGLTVVTFNYPFTEAGRRRPDPANRLLEVHAAVLDWTRRTVAPKVVLAGRSMGGRMATMLVADGTEVEGVVLYAYPLHPAGRPDRLRVEHLPRVGVPMLFFQGSRDALSTPDLFDRHVRPLPGVTVIDLEGADHSFRMPGVDRAALARRLATGTREWMARHLADPGGGGA